MRFLAKWRKPSYSESAFIGDCSAMGVRICSSVVGAFSLLIFVPWLALAVFFPVSAQSAGPDTIFIGTFFTLDPAHPKAEAMAVSAGRIIAIGSRSEVVALAAKGTHKIEINGVALPGFADAHVHVEGVGQQLDQLDLRGLTKAEILAKVAEAARPLDNGSWITGGGWDEGFWHPSVFPTASELDVVSGHHPVVLSRIDGHSTWVN